MSIKLLLASTGSKLRLGRRFELGEDQPERRQEPVKHLDTSEESKSLSGVLS